MSSAENSSDWRKKLGVLNSVLGPLLALVIVIVVFLVADWVHEGPDRFGTQENFQNIAVSTATVAVAALGMTLVIIAGGIDLSAGTAIALCATILAWGLKEDVATLTMHGDNVERASKRLTSARSEFDSIQKRLISTTIKLTEQQRQELEDKQKRAMADVEIGKLDLQLASAAAERWHKWTPTVAIFLCILTGCFCGALNGVLVSTLRVVPFIVTLGTMMIYLGMAKHIGAETTVRPARDSIPEWLHDFTSLLQKALIKGVPLGERWRGLPIGVWLVPLLALGLAAILRYSVFGRHIFALGSNESTAKLCGINVPLTKIAVYTFAGFFVGVAGIYQFSRLTVGNPTSGSGLELKIIAAVVIGGASLNGGRGTVLGTLSGAAIMSVIATGCNLIDMKNPIQDMILGAIIIAAVCVDQFRQRRIGK